MSWINIKANFAMQSMAQPALHGFTRERLDDQFEVQSREFFEIVVTWNSQKLNRPLWKTKKFYNKLGVDLDYGDTALGKAFGYFNKLLEGRWLNDSEYDAAWKALLEIESGPHGQKCLWESGSTTRKLTGLYLRTQLDGLQGVWACIGHLPYEIAVYELRRETGIVLHAETFTGRPLKFGRSA